MLSRIETRQTRRAGLELYLLQDCAQPAIVRGNKRYKLGASLGACAPATQVLSFGGRHSNHIHALAWAAREQGLGSVGVIRGAAAEGDTATLRDARNWGMQLEFVSRAEYRRRHDPCWLQHWQQRYPDACLLPEGGSNLQAVLACRHMLDSLAPQFLSTIDTLACAVGTGATACGLSLALTPGQRLRGYPVVADPGRDARMRDWLAQASQAHAPIDLRAPLRPAYGKVNQALGGFIDAVFTTSGVLLDPLYTGKMLHQLMHDIDSGELLPGSVVLALHTGGLQGWRGCLSACTPRLSAATLAAVQDCISPQSSV